MNKKLQRKSVFNAACFLSKMMMMLSLGTAFVFLFPIPATKI